MASGALISGESSASCAVAPLAPEVVAHEGMREMAHPCKPSTEEIGLTYRLSSVVGRPLNQRAYEIETERTVILSRCHSSSIAVRQLHCGKTTSRTALLCA